MTKGTTGNQESPLAISWCSPSSSSGRRGGCVPLSPASLWGQRPQPGDTSSWEVALGGLKSQLGGGHGEGTGGPGDKGNLGTPRGCSARSVHPGCPGGCRAVGGGKKIQSIRKDRDFWGHPQREALGTDGAGDSKAPANCGAMRGWGSPGAVLGGKPGSRGCPHPQPSPAGVIDPNGVVQKSRSELAGVGVPGEGTDCAAGPGGDTGTQR